MPLRFSHSPAPSKTIKNQRSFGRFFAVTVKIIDAIKLSAITLKEGRLQSQTLKLQTLEEAQDDVVPVLDDRPSWDLRRSLEDQGSDVYEVPAGSIRSGTLTSSQF